MKKILIVLVAVLCVFSLTACAEELTWWNDGASRTAFLDYVADVTDPASANFIPETDRIAVFDLDGTLCGEQFPIYFEWMMYVQRVLDDPDYTPTEEQIDVAQEILIAASEQSIPEDLEAKEYHCNSEVFAGMTVEDYRDYVKRFLQETSADRFSGLTLENAWFRTTLEAAQYLQKHGFTVYVVSGTERDACRMMIAQVLGIPYRQVIGSDCYTVASGQGEDDYMDYQYDAEDVPVRTSDGIIKNVKSSKPMQIIQEIGQQPVLAFGNSTGDASMFMFTTSQNKYRAIAFCILPDDDTREVAYPAKTEKLTALCEENGWFTVSMKDDFVTIYGDDVQLEMNSTPWLDRMMELLEELRAADAA